VSPRNVTLSWPTYSTCLAPKSRYSEWADRYIQRRSFCITIGYICFFLHKHISLVAIWLDKRACAGSRCQLSPRNVALSWPAHYFPRFNTRSSIAHAITTRLKVYNPYYCKGPLAVHIWRHAVFAIFLLPTHGLLGSWFNGTKPTIWPTRIFDCQFLYYIATTRVFLKFFVQFSFPNLPKGF